ncbi:MAG: lysylphosphatidylglycerol synthase transmembrane domain-containing protein [Terrimicrobiaceae bacterium]
MKNRNDMCGQTPEGTGLPPACGAGPASGFGLQTGGTPVPPGPATFVTGSPENKKNFRKMVLPIQASVSTALLAWLFTRPDFRAHLCSVFLSADPRWLLGGFLLAGIVQFLCLLRWRIFLRMAGIEAGLAEAASIFFAGLFCNLFLPGGAGGDVVRVGLLAARGKDVGRSVISVLMDRLCGSVSMILLGAPLMFWQFSWLSKSPLVAGLVHTVAVYLAVLTGLIALSIFLSARGMVTRLPDRWPGRKRLVELSGVYFQCAVQWPRTLRALGISLVMLALFFLTYYCSGRAYGVDLFAGKFLALMPAVDIISGLPVSLGGMGVRESLFVFLLGNLAAVDAPLAVSISVCGYLMSALWGLPGAFCWLVGRRG